MTAAITLNPLTLPLSGTRLIEASAGTGKTYTIAALYVRLILGHDPDQCLLGRELLPPDILVVTFTDAATKELRERIRDRLSLAARYFRQQVESDDGFLVALRAEFASSVWAGCARRLELAANWMDEAAVYTIHSWCNRMLQQHAFDSGSLFRQALDNDDTELLNVALQDYWRSFYYQIAADDPAFHALYALFKQPDEILAEMGGLLKNSDAISDAVALGADIKTVITAVQHAKQAVLQALKQPWQQWLPEIEAVLATAIKAKVLPAKNYKVNFVQGWLAKIRAWSLDPQQETLDLGKGFESLSPQGMALLANPGQTPPQHEAFAAIAQLPTQLAALPSLKVELLKHAIQWIRQRYAQEKHRTAKMTFDDMLTRLDNALQGDNGPQLAAVIRQQYPIALIDEFQDTDPVQYRIFSSVYPAAGQGFGCFMIGDPKQAIYSFRGADIYTYLTAHQATQGRHYTLSTNFRSSAALVAAVNQVFLQADQHAAGAFRFKTGDTNLLPFMAVAAQGRNQEWCIGNQVAPALTVWHWAADEAVSQSLYRKHMAELTASEIVRLLSVPETGFKTPDGVMQRLQPADMAILVRSGTEAKAMRKALAKRQLRSVYLSERDSIFATPEARDVLCWLKALAHPRDERKVRAALSTATFAWSYHTLQQLALHEPTWELQLERFLAYQQRWQQDGILPCLRQLIFDYDLHLRLVDDPEGERCITNLLHLAELLQQASSQLEGEQALIRHLAEAIKADGRAVADEGIIRLESDANLIKIITIHKSKGLEYPLVFIPFICSYREVSAANNKYYRYHDAQQHLKIDLDKHEAIRHLSDHERLQEDVRLLYVAMTRARFACWLGIAPIKVGNGKACQLEKSAMGALLAWQAGTAANALGAQCQQLKGDSPHIAIVSLPTVSTDLYQPELEVAPPDAARTVARKLSNNWWVASYSALQLADQTSQLPLELETAHEDKQQEETEPKAEPLVPPPEGLHNLPRGAKAGVLIHDLLEYCAGLGFAEVLEQPSLLDEVVAKRFAGDEWQGCQATVVAAVAAWLAMPLIDADGVCLAALDTSAYQAELEFLIGADGVKAEALDRWVTQFMFTGCPRPGLQPKYINGLLKGFIDLVFVHQGKYYLVDYKFNSLGTDAAAYGAETLVAAMMAKRYDLQAALYMLALHRLLKVRLGEAYDYDSHFGGSVYVFLRGVDAPTGGRVVMRPGQAFIEGLDGLFSGSTEGL